MTTTTKSHSPAEGVSETVTRTRGWYAWLMLGIGVSGLAIGAALGTVTLLLRPESELHKSQNSYDSGSRDENQNLVDRGDEKLLEREYGAALSLYRSYLGPEPPPLVQLRVAMCLDGLGQWGEAQQIYAALAQRFPQTALAFACQVALARLEYRQGRHRAARQRLAQALLHAPDHMMRQPGVLGALRLQYFAWSLMGRAQGRTPSVLEPALVSAPWSLEPPEVQWLWMSKLGEQALRSWPVPDETWQIQSGPLAEEMLVNCNISRRTFADTLQRLAQEARLELHCSNMAQAALGQRLLQDVRIENYPLGEVVSLLTEAVDCVWYRQENRLYVLSNGERALAEHSTQKVPIAELIRESTNRATLATLNRLLLQGQDGAIPDSHRLFWLKGWCHYELGQRREASTWWERLLLRWPQQSEAYYANFNLGVLSWQEGDTETAKRMWMRAADQAPEHQFTPWAYLYIGRAELEQLHVEAAVTPLRRAASSSATPEPRTTALLLLAACYLYSDNPAAAHQVLVEHRRSFVAEPMRSCAAFLDALARSRLRSHRAAARQEAEDLLTALLHVPDWRLLEPLGPLLAGQAWMRLHLPEQALRIYRLVLPRARSVYRRELLLAYGESCLALGLHAELRRSTSELLQSPDTTRSAAAHWLLARSAFHQADYSRAVEHARQVLLQPGQIPRTEILHLMGQAYVALGDVQRAADCFAGRFPES
ncbi:MAG: tetratricopeptide repeat protein [Gemmatales bacterium]|nr:tetratricopeptide repeat protein [Gemmatales bacterium]MDW8174743.1 tetratricopeptide repeat protein [Gemmatales bacterium]